MSEIRGEHVGGCNEWCDAQSHYLTGEQADETTHIDAILLPLRVWLAHAGYGLTRLTAARKALDDFRAALAGDPEESSNA